MAEGTLQWSRFQEGNKCKMSYDYGKWLWVKHTYSSGSSIGNLKCWRPYAVSIVICSLYYEDCVHRSFIVENWWRKIKAGPTTWVDFLGHWNTVACSQNCGTTKRKKKMISRNKDTTLVPVVIDSPINIEGLRWMWVIIGYISRSEWKCSEDVYRNLLSVSPTLTDTESAHCL